MNNIKSIFSIKDLENLSGIKAHTIRIWEKRYNVLEPMRTDTNIRYYDLASLQKLLNITLLHNHGYKISKISKISADKIPAMVKEIINEKSVKHHAINAFKLAMMNFDQAMFFRTYNSLLHNKSFKDVFFDVFVPLLQEIGILWQTDTITPAHEHFITYLIKQKILVQTEKIQINDPIYHDKVFVLFLPLNEIHELGLMYLNYEIISNGYRTIFLGESVPTDSLKNILTYFDNPVFLTYMTVEPDKEYINDYLKDVHDQVLSIRDSKLWAVGKNTEFINKDLHPNVVVFNSISELVNNL
jgi:DNA-binding transcriptional MerR regulator